MKITTINAYPTVRGPAGFNVDFSVEILGDCASAISSVLALFAGSHHVTSITSGPTLSPTTHAETIPVTAEPIRLVVTGETAEGDMILKPVEQVAPPAAPVAATRTRRARTAPDAAPAASNATPDMVEAPHVVSDVAPTTSRRRTPVTATVEPEVKVITDADLARACSNAAAVIGPEVVKTVVADFHVTTVSELAANVRERFLKELDDEVSAAKEEMTAKAGA